MTRSTYDSIPASSGPTKASGGRRILTFNDHVVMSDSGIDAIDFFEDVHLTVEHI